MRATSTLQKRFPPTAPLYLSAPQASVALPEAVRQHHDRSSQQIADHAAAPCPEQVKTQMIDWWGPIIHEYCGATEGMGFTACNSAEWLAHPGSVGKVLMGELHVLDEAMKPTAKGQPGERWFKTANPIVYFNDPARTQETRSADGTRSTVGDVGYLAVVQPMPGVVADAAFAESLIAF